MAVIGVLMNVIPVKKVRGESGASASPLKLFLYSNYMKVSPYHSIQPGIEVYHNSNQCTEGNNIERQNRRQGTGGKRLCDHCKRLEK
ncbi:MAG: hypothetical protein ACD_72C00100G0006 [uncultured bacterium]|nr:MAG: hypothetical protein ACD_72C00100G0006 [uncultured bacterium]